MIRFEILQNEKVSGKSFQDFTFILMIWIYRNSSFIFLFGIIELFGRISSNEISCERTEDMSWPSLGREQFSFCWMQQASRIRGQNVVISSVDDSILGLTFLGNKNIRYLPINVAGSFPNLIAYGASDTSISEIWKDNFKNLRQLRALSLFKNQIEIIFSDTFEDLKNLEFLWLGKLEKYFENGLR